MGTIEFGLVLPTMPDGASAEGIEAAAEVAERLGWASVWATDHVLVEHASAGDYGTIFEALTTLAHVGGRHSRVRLGTSVVVVPQRNAVLLAKELATLDALTRGRVIAGVGIDWNRTEFGNIGVVDRFGIRGAYLDETIRLWRHLWSGSQEPFRGRFHTIEDFVFGPLPAQRASLPVWVGGRSERAYRRAGRLGDGYQSSQASPALFGERVQIVRAAAVEAGRSMPELSARVRVRFERPGEGYAIGGTPEQMQAEVRAFAEVGVGHLVLAFGETNPERVVAAADRFDREVVAALKAGSAV